MKEATSWIKKLSKNTCVLYVPNALILDEAFPFKIEDDKEEVLIKIEDNKLIISKIEGGK